jgi:adenylate cyclase
MKSKILNPSNPFPYRILYLSIPLFANLIAVATSFGFNDLIFLPEERSRFRAFQEAVPWSLWVVNISPLIVVILSIFYYLCPLLKELNRFNSNKSISNISAKKILNAPLVISLLAMGGWILGIAIAVALQVYYIQNVTLRGMSITIANLLSLSSITFVFTYYSLDLINREKVINQFLTNRSISEIEGVMKPPIVLRFFIFFFSVSVLPILILTLMLARSILAHTGTFHSTFILVPLGMLMIGALLCFLLAKAFNKPLVEMKNAVKEIQQGRYDVDLQITSADELGLLGEGITNMVLSLRDKDFIKETFGKVVDPIVRDHLLGGNIRLGGESRIATILFSDIRDFTTLSEKLTPAQVVEMLNVYFETMSKCIEAEGGLINKYIGDAIMAIFNVPVPKENHAKSAYLSAKNMLAKLEAMNIEFGNRGLPMLDIGIGLHTGEVLAGNIGSSSRLEYTVIGDSVNVASRIEGLCKITKQNILLSEATAKEMKDDVALKSLGSFELKGRKERIEIFTG